MFEVFQIYHFVTSAQYNHQKYYQLFCYEQPLSEIKPEFSALCHIQIKCPRLKGRLQSISVRSPHQYFNSQYILWGLECKSRKLRNTWSNRQIWPWSTDEMEQKLTEFCQENALVIANTLFQQHKRRLYMDITRWSTLKSG